MSPAPVGHFGVDEATVVGALPVAVEEGGSVGLPTDEEVVGLRGVALADEDVADSDGEAARGVEVVGADVGVRDGSALLVGVADSIGLEVCTGFPGRLERGAVFGRPTSSMVVPRPPDKA